MKNDDELMSAEELFGVKEVKDVRPRGARPRRVKKSAQDPLAEIKVKMVMRIYNVSRTRALEMIAGRDAARPGEAKNSWLTGTAAWNWYAVSSYILGIRPDWDGLLIDPCVPKSCKGFTVRRRFRGAEYEITVENPDGVEKGVREIIVDGAGIDGNLIPSTPGRHVVRVTMG